MSLRSFSGRNRPNPAAYSPSKAFTLVELLLGIAVAALIGLSVYNVFWSGLKVDERLRWVHENYLEMLMADQTLGRDLENAVSLDYSASYPDRPVFEGKAHAVSFFSVTPAGIRRITYTSGLVDFGKATKVLIGRHMDHAVGGASGSGESPVEFLLRQEQPLPEWLNGAEPKPPQIVAAGLKKGSFTCRYAAASKELPEQGGKAVDFKEQWSDGGLPMAVRCGFSVYDARHPDEGILFQRDFFLAPVEDHGTA